MGRRSRRLARTSAATGTAIIPHRSVDVGFLVDAARFAGADVLLVQGGGGNVSVKTADGERMLVKASGVRLADVRDGQGYLVTDLRALVALVRDPELARMPRALAHEDAVRRTQAAVLEAGRLRASLETGFHAVLGRVVLHTHPVYVNAFACMEDGEAAVVDRLDPGTAWVAYRSPGYALAVEVDRACRAQAQRLGAEPDAVVLANHGSIASGASADSVIATTRRLVAMGQACFGALPHDARAVVAPPTAVADWATRLARALERRGFRGRTVRPARYAALLRAAHEPNRWLTAGPLIPDDVVYSGRRVWAVEPTRDPGTWLEAEVGAPPERMVVAVVGLGVVFVAAGGRTIDAMEETLLAHVLTRRLIAPHGRARTLPEAEVDALVAMESEHYRAAVAAGAAPHG